MKVQILRGNLIQVDTDKKTMIIESSYPHVKQDEIPYKLDDVKELDVDWFWENVGKHVNALIIDDIITRVAVS